MDLQQYSTSPLWHSLITHSSCSSIARNKEGGLLLFINNFNKKEKEKKKSETIINNGFNGIKLKVCLQEMHMTTASKFLLYLRKHNILIL